MIKSGIKCSVMIFIQLMYAKNKTCFFDKFGKSFSIYDLKKSSESALSTDAYSFNFI